MDEQKRTLSADEFKKISLAKELTEIKQWIDNNNFPGISIDCDCVTITIDKVTIDDDIRLNYIDCVYNLVVSNTTFKKDFDVSGAHFKKSLNLSGCNFEQNVNFERTQIDGNLLLTGIKIESCQDTPTGVKKVSDQKSANFKQVYVGGNLDASATSERQMTCSGSINLNRARVLGKVSFNGAKITGDLLLQGAEINGNFFCRPKGKNRTEIGGRVWLRGAKIKSQVDLGGASIGAKGFEPTYEDDLKLPIALALEAAKLEDGLFCSPYPQGNDHSKAYHTEIFGFAWLLGVKITGKLDFSGASIKGNLVLREAKIEGKLDLTPEIFDSSVYCTEITGKADLARVKVSDGVLLSGVKIGKDLSKEEKSEGALILKEAEIQGGLKLSRFESIPKGHSEEEKKGDLQHSTKIYGTTSLSGAKVSGGADFSEAFIEGA